jgi:hypothetical protein
VIVAARNREEPGGDPFRGRGKQKVVAIIGMPDSGERSKFALIFRALRRSGATPLFFDAELFAKGYARVENLDGRSPAISVRHGLSIQRAKVNRISGAHFDERGEKQNVHIDGIDVVTNNWAQTIISENAQPSTERSLVDVIPVDGFLLDGLDVVHRPNFQTLIADISRLGLPCVSGTWEAVQNTTYKNLTYDVLRRAGLPLPKTVKVSATASDLKILRAREELGAGQVNWVKRVNSSHCEGIDLARHREDIIAFARNAMSPTPAGELCLLQQDVATFAVDAATHKQLYRVDLGLTCLDGVILQATARFNEDIFSPTGGGRGGRSMPIDPSQLSDQICHLGPAAIAGTGHRYGSSDILGGWNVGDKIFSPYGLLDVVRSDAVAVAEVNFLPGGHSPGFERDVLPPLLDALFDAVDRFREYGAEPRIYTPPLAPKGATQDPLDLGRRFGS